VAGHKRERKGKGEKKQEKNKKKWERALKLVRFIILEHYIKEESSEGT
jgi:hypothetical protein